MTKKRDRVTYVFDARTAVAGSVPTSKIILLPKTK